MMPEDSWEWMALGLLLFIFGGIIGAFALYLRTSYRKGGWKRVRTDFIVASVVLLLFAALRISQNLEIQQLRQAAERWFR